MKLVHGNKGPQGQPQTAVAQNMQVKVALKDTTDLSCESCDHRLFIQLMMFKKLIITIISLRQHYLSGYKGIFSANWHPC